jgi:hypothetical protein
MYKEKAFLLAVFKGIISMGIPIGKVDLTILYGS